MNKLVPCYRGAVDAWECDQMGHMNVQFYTSKAAQAFGHLQNSLGLSPAYVRLKKKGCGLKICEFNTRQKFTPGPFLTV